MRIRNYLQAHVWLFAIFLFTACSSTKPSIIYMVSGTETLPKEQSVVWVERDGERLAGKQKLELKPGDRVVIEDGVDGVGLRTFQTLSTVFGNAGLNVEENNIVQTSGTVLHEATEPGTVFFPGYSIKHEGSTSYILELSDTVNNLTVLAGSITLGSEDSSFPPLIIESGHQRRIWKDSNQVSPSRPMKSSNLNTWISFTNQLLSIAGEKGRLVPHVRGLSPDDAIGFLKTAALKGQEEYITEGEAADELGNISKQEPAGALRLNRNSAVSYFVRSAPVEVPNLLDLVGEAQVTAKLEEVGLALGDVSESILGVPEGTITGQDPAPKEVAAKYSKVNITKEVKSIEIPNLLGQSEDQARKTLFDIGLPGLTVRRREYVDTKTAPYPQENYPRVSNQREARTRVRPNTEIWVDLQVLGQIVPDLTGLTLQEAENKLKKLGFGIGRVRQQTVAAENVNKVLSFTGSSTVREAISTSTPIDLVVGVVGPAEVTQ